MFRKVMATLLALVLVLALVPALALVPESDDSDLHGE